MKKILFFLILVTSIFKPTYATNNYEKEVNDKIYELYSEIKNYWLSNNVLNKKKPPQLIITDKNATVLGGCLDLNKNEITKVLLSHFCGATNTIFITREHIDMLHKRYGIQGVLFLTAHELGHSLQYGFSSKLKNPARELQAYCFGSRLTKFYGPSMSEEEKVDFSEMFIAWDNEIHGSGIERTNAIKMGLGLSKGDCRDEEIMSLISEKAKD